jgi:hypothetical protein
MGMTPEGKVKKAIKELLKKHEAYVYMPVPAGYGAPSLDFVGCHCGLFYAIEAKRPGKEPTAQQRLTARTMEQAGAVTFVVASTDGADFKKLEEWLELFAET